MRISENRFEKDLRRYTLAQRMLQHEARRGTIVRWTGLSRHRVALMIKSRAETDKSRLRGPPPCKPAYFCKSLILEMESAAFAYVGIQMGAIGQPGAVLLPGVIALSQAERVVNAFELYHSIVPQTQFTLEHVMLLVLELSTQEFLVLDVCEDCEGIRVREKIGPPQPLCAFCRARGLRPAVPMAWLPGEESWAAQESDKAASTP